MINFYCVLITVVLSFEVAMAKKPEIIKLSSTVYDTQHLPMIENKDYLSMQIPFLPVKNVYEQLKKRYPMLITRGEAHITVLTPPEFNSFNGIKITEIQKFAREQNMQSCEFEILGLGHGKLQTTDDENFFLVVESQCLLNFRRELKKHFRLKEFNSDHFYSHITVGYTRRDLYEQDGVIKDENSIDPRYELKMTTL